MPMLRCLRLKGGSAFWKSRAWKIARSSLRTLRPVLLAALAAGGFALLLRWHQGKFERDMVSNFQHYQSQTANTTCDPIRHPLAISTPAPTCVQGPISTLPAIVAAGSISAERWINCGSPSRSS